MNFGSEGELALVREVLRIADCLLVTAAHGSRTTLHGRQCRIHQSLTLRGLRLERPVTPNEKLVSNLLSEMIELADRNEQPGRQPGIIQASKYEWRLSQPAQLLAKHLNGKRAAFGGNQRQFRANFNRLVVCTGHSLER